jgi:hypothetical protein
VIIPPPAFGKCWRALATNVRLGPARNATLRRPLLGAPNEPRQLRLVSSRVIVDRFVVASSLASAALTRLRLGPTGPAARDLARALPPALLAVTTTRIDLSTSRADSLYERLVPTATSAHARLHRCHVKLKFAGSCSHEPRRATNLWPSVRRPWIVGATTSAGAGLGIVAPAGGPIGGPEDPARITAIASANCSVTQALPAASRLRPS